jgi:hypothetical protein
VVDLITLAFHDATPVEREDIADFPSDSSSEAVVAARIETGATVADVLLAGGGELMLLVVDSRTDVANEVVNAAVASLSCVAEMVDLIAVAFRDAALDDIVVGSPDPGCLTVALDAPRAIVVVVALLTTNGEPGTVVCVPAAKLDDEVAPVAFHRFSSTASIVDLMPIALPDMALCELIAPVDSLPAPCTAAVAVVVLAANCELPELSELTVSRSCSYWRVVKDELPTPGTAVADTTVSLADGGNVAFVVVDP